MCHGGAGSAGASGRFTAFLCLLAVLTDLPVTRTWHSHRSEHIDVDKGCCTYNYKIVGLS